MILCPRRCISTSQAFNEIVGRATFAPTRTMLRNGMKRILCRGELSTALSEYSLPGYSSIYAVSAMNCVVAPHMPARVASSLSRPLSTYLPPGYGHTLPVRASNAVAPEISHDKANHDLEWLCMLFQLLAVVGFHKELVKHTRSPFPSFSPCSSIFLPLPPKFQLLTLLHVS